MSREDTYATRHPIAEQALSELKAARYWESEGRISGCGSTPSFEDLECLSDRSVVLEYLRREEEIRA